MINFREIFNTNYNFIFIVLTLLIFIILIISTKDLKYIGALLIKTSIFLIILALTTPIFIDIFNNDIIKIFITPIIDSIKSKILISSTVILIIGVIMNRIKSFQ